MQEEDKKEDSDGGSASEGSEKTAASGENTNGSV